MINYTNVVEVSNNHGNLVFWGYICPDTTQCYQMDYNSSRELCFLRYFSLLGCSSLW